MSFTVSSTPNEDPATIRALLHANLLSVFNERDEASRKAAVQSTYAEDIVWYESDINVIVGHDTLNKRAEELLAESPGFAFKPEGEMIVSQNLGILSWMFGPPEEPDLAKGTDVIIVQDGKVKALWTAVTKSPAQG